MAKAGIELLRARVTDNARIWMRSRSRGDNAATA